MTRPPEVVTWDPADKAAWSGQTTRAKRYRAGERAKDERQRLAQLEIEHARYRVAGDAEGMARTLKRIRATERRIAELERLPESRS